MTARAATAPTAATKQPGAHRTSLRRGTRRSTRWIVGLHCRRAEQRSRRRHRPAPASGHSRRIVRTRENHFQIFAAVKRKALRSRGLGILRERQSLHAAIPARWPAVCWTGVFTGAMGAVTSAFAPPSLTHGSGNGRGPLRRREGDGTVHALDASSAGSQRMIADVVIADDAPVKGFLVETGNRDITPTSRLVAPDARSTTAVGGQTGRCPKRTRSIGVKAGDLIGAHDKLDRRTATTSRSAPCGEEAYVLGPTRRIGAWPAVGAVVGRHPGQCAAWPFSWPRSTDTLESASLRLGRHGCEARANCEESAPAGAEARRAGESFRLRAPGGNRQSVRSCR